MTSEVNRLLAELPASVHALTGVDLSKVRARPHACWPSGEAQRPSTKASWHLSSLQIPLIKKATGAQV